VFHSNAVCLPSLVRTCRSVVPFPAAWFVGRRYGRTALNDLPPLSAIAILAGLYQPSVPSAALSRRYSADCFRMRFRCEPLAAGRTGLGLVAFAGAARFGVAPACCVPRTARHNVGRYAARCSLAGNGALRAAKQTTRHGCAWQTPLSGRTYFALHSSLNNYNMFCWPPRRGFCAYLRIPFCGDVQLFMPVTNSRRRGRLFLPGGAAINSFRAG